MSSYTRRERGRVRISNMCAPFTAIEFLKALVHALMTYKSPLSFDGVVLVEMFDIGVNNAHWCQTNRSLLYTPTATVCIWRTPVDDSILSKSPWHRLSESASDIHYSVIQYRNAKCMECADGSFLATMRMQFQSHIQRKWCLSILLLIASECVARFLCSIAVYQMLYSVGNSDHGTVAGLIFF